MYQPHIKYCFLPTWISKCKESDSHLDYLPVGRRQNGKLSFRCQWRLFVVLSGNLKLFWGIQDNALLCEYCLEAVNIQCFKQSEHPLDLALCSPDPEQESVCAPPSRSPPISTHLSSHTWGTITQKSQCLTQNWQWVILFVWFLDGFFLIHIVFEWWE